MQLRKQFQRRLYAVLGTWYGVLVVLLCAALVLSSTLYLSATLLTFFSSSAAPSPSISHTKSSRSSSTFSSTSSSFASSDRSASTTPTYISPWCRELTESSVWDRSERTIQERRWRTQVCAEPVDVVYTWVNGSDPRHQHALQEYMFRTSPIISNCTEARETLRIAEQRLARLRELELLVAHDTAYYDDDDWPSSSYSNDAENEFDDTPAQEEQSANTQTDSMPSTSSSSSSENGYEEELATLRAMNLEPLPEIPEDCPSEDVTSMSRFHDNEELRYSMRSLFKYAPWVRKVYLVTNGQVPYWLDLSYERVSVVTHEEIFTNLSHLPTFSSPAIEVHLHRIPGLADRFIYLNDDVMFGRDVWPDDFITGGNGQRIFFAWPVPNCNEGCPSTWIGDGYCDLACNTTSCGFDGGDCANQPAASQNSWWSDPNTETQPYCARGCPDSWVGDKYCDRSCQNLECAMDAGDCSMEELYESVYGIQLPERGAPLTPAEVSALRAAQQAAYMDKENDAASASSAAMESSQSDIDGNLPLSAEEPLEVDEVYVLGDFVLPSLEPSLFVNLSAAVGEHAVIVDGSHDAPDMVRTASITQMHQLMVFTFHRERPLTVISVSITCEEKRDGSEKPVLFEILFNVTLSTESPDEHDDGAGREDDEAVAEQTEQGVDPSQNDELSPTDEPPSTGGVSAEAQEWISRRLLSMEPVSSMVPPALQRLWSFVWPPIAQLREPSASSWWMSGGRRLLDTFGDSLKYVDRLLSVEFGPVARHVPAHMPHFIQKSVMDELQAKYAKEYERTSSHQVRSSEDMQMAFTYFYWIIHAPRDFSLNEVWHTMLDSDQDGVLNDNEMRTLAALVRGREPLEDDTVETLHRDIYNRTVLSKAGWSSQLSARLGGLLGHQETSLPPVTLEMLQADETILRPLREFWRSLGKYRHEEEDASQVAFLMIGTNDTDLSERLDGIRRDRQKFICLNDNIDHTQPHAINQLRIIRQFYEALFPVRSPFELPDGHRNPYLHMDELFPDRSHRPNTRSQDQQWPSTGDGVSRSTDPARVESTIQMATSMFTSGLEEQPYLMLAAALVSVIGLLWVIRLLYAVRHRRRHTSAAQPSRNTRRPSLRRTGSHHMFLAV
mmetsp:Transcript_26095/g.65591  ORF Transcript_26095/g.65591 Transcript_26095/m.65591 type:complete len:1122 (+) Transcript_26095:89-3454(+)|eukprot:CAMPEP_0174234608 /NCGR_PEP_ID=MMETSP0417-20130205/4311_1 /TAXON_ID=242541 /ORGANISM="Mayorella sp, Strain BSH-02190019" /LENGTH=1121 /DNA_ID=CAMNT_0015312993 /DNA_START=26 /DNA_END=3391 /DNA_ORIENTATION=+